MSGGIRRWSAVVGAIVAATAFAPAAHAHGRVSLDDLKVERKAQPLGIDVQHPRFSWVVASKERDTVQRSYRLKLSTRGKTVWDSGTVRSQESSDVAYDGPALAAATRYDWRVEVATNDGSADASSTFRTGLTADADWAGSAWIGNARTVETNPLTFDGANWIWTPEATTPVAPAEPRAFRFTRTGGGLAEIIITADDSYKLWVNGKLLGETAGAENEWQGARRFTTTLDAGRNVFAVRTTNGPGSPAGLLIKVRVGEEVFTTGTDWKAAKTFPEDFYKPDFDDSAWGNAVVQAPYGSGPWGRNVRAPRDAARPAPLLRREFAVTGRVREATLYYAAGGYANVSLNGRPASDEVLSPGFTDYDDTVQYQATDVTQQLRPGANAIGAELGRGFYGMTGGNVWRWESPPWHDEPVMRARLRIEYTDGRVQDVVTDDSWQIADGPTVFDDLYGGETYDARLANPSAWAAASEVAGPKGELVNMRQQPIRVTEALPATEITEPQPDTYVVKFPRVLAGWVEFALSGPAGTTIRAQYGEKLLPDGTVNVSNNGGFQSGFQTDRFILAGTGATERWQARFSYKGFQYIQVTGWPGDAPPPLSAFTAKAVHTDAPETGSFTSSSDVMNRTHRAVVDTLLNNLHGIPTDTPMFEKNGWTGDAALGAEMFMMNLDVHELFAKWLRDVDETREPNGRPLVIAPSSGDWGVWGIAPPWHSAYVLIPEWLYAYGGDKQPVSQLYDGMKKYVDLEFDTAGDGIVDNARLGDWVSPEASPAGGNAPEDIRISATAYLYTMLKSMERSAQLLGKPDAAHFAERAAVVKAAFNAAFLDRTAGYYRGSGDRGYRQTHNVLAVAFGLTPDADTEQRVVDSIAADVRAKGDTLNTGVLGTKYLLPVLTDHGHADLAYTLATQTKYPSWGYMLANGATSMWEHWSLDARSRGHYFLGTVDDWFFHHVAGIRTTDGYRTVTIAPAVTGELEWARASTRTPFGPVTSDWRKRGRTLELRVDVPVGSVATVRVPAENVAAVTESGEPLDDADGVRSVRDDGDAVLVTVGSGRYAFEADEQMALSGRVLERIDALAERGARRRPAPVGRARAAALARRRGRRGGEGAQGAAARRRDRRRRGPGPHPARARRLRRRPPARPRRAGVDRAPRGGRRGDHGLPRRAADGRRGPGDGTTWRPGHRARRRRQRRPRDPARRPREADRGARGLAGAVRRARGGGRRERAARRRGGAWRRGGARRRARRRRLARRGSRRRAARAARDRGRAVLAHRSELRRRLGDVSGGARVRYAFDGAGGRRLHAADREDRVAAHGRVGARGALTGAAGRDGQP